jgi:hypothetical protein
MEANVVPGPGISRAATAGAIPPPAFIIASLIAARRRA